MEYSAGCLPLVRQGLTLQIAMEIQDEIRINFFDRRATATYISPGPTSCMDGSAKLQEVLAFSSRHRSCRIDGNGLVANRNHFMHTCGPGEADMVCRGFEFHVVTKSTSAEEA
jgi:hypothetical protein